jgi:hypothetical protein
MELGNKLKNTTSKTHKAPIRNDTNSQWQLVPYFSGVAPLQENKLKLINSSTF